MGNTIKLSFTNHIRIKKLACLFAGLGHLQPLLLATTNSNYLLDRFCMERCCSSEYISRIVTSIIFMEILSILVVRITIVTVLRIWKDPGWSGTQNLNNWNEHKEWYIGPISAGILCLIFLGYLQILLAFVSGGKKGHMHWFSSSLLIQHFLNSLIAGSIGFWEVGLALWYLVTLPMAPIIVFFYQLYIHSWIRNHGPRDVEYIVVEYQIWLALIISGIATALWTLGYTNPTTPIELNLQNPTESSNNKITQTDVKLTIVTITKQFVQSVTLNNVATTSTSTNIKVKSATLTLTLDLSNLTSTPLIDNIKVYSVTQTISVNVTLSGQSNVPLVYRETLVPKPGHSEKTLKLVYENSDVTKDKLNIQTSSNTGNITLNSDITVAIETNGSLTGNSVTLNSVTLYLTSDGTAEPKTLTGTPTTQNLTSVQVEGYAFSPKDSFYIYSVKDSRGTNEDPTRDIWASGGRHVHATCYSKSNKALLCLSVYAGDTFTNNLFFGRENTAGTNTWKTIPSEAKFLEYLAKLPSSGPFSHLPGTATDQYNRYFDMVLWNNWDWSKPAATWFPLIMQGLSVGAVGSIFPNLIPKTLVCPKTTRTLSVMNMFMVTVPHIFNVMLGDMGSSWFAAHDWKVWPGYLWPCSLLLYIFYILAILFAIFNIHYPEWRLSSFLRNNTWMVFLMILFTDVLNESFNAISRAGICSQKSAAKTPNHPCLHNKIACLMNLTYIPFWMTTTPMMKSYVSSLDPFLCDKDRDHWPTARYGAWRSGWYWCKCACRGLYTSPRKLVTLNMRKALTRKDPKMYFLVTHDIPPED